jgi:fumigallin biosynthesis monooxygenase-like protein
MADLAGRRMRAEIDGDFVVFLIGARLNNKRQLVRSLVDLGGRRGMKHMLDYLVAHPEKGLLAYEMGIPTIVQYWRSFEQLEAFASDKNDPHADVWRQYWRRVGRSGRTGIWHETYLVKAGQYEAIYGNMPPHGLGKAGRLLPASESSSARARLAAPSLSEDLAVHSS